jgi:hypothetical protein
MGSKTGNIVIEAEDIFDIYSDNANAEIDNNIQDLSKINSDMNGVLSKSVAVVLRIAGILEVLIQLIERGTWNPVISKETMISSIKIVEAMVKVKACWLRGTDELHTLAMRVKDKIMEKDSEFQGWFLPSKVAQMCNWKSGGKCIDSKMYRKCLEILEKENFVAKEGNKFRIVVEVEENDRIIDSTYNSVLSIMKGYNLSQSSQDMRSQDSTVQY